VLYVAAAADELLHWLQGLRAVVLLLLQLTVLAPLHCLLLLPARTAFVLAAGYGCMRSKRSVSCAVAELSCNMLWVCCGCSSTAAALLACALVEVADVAASGDLWNSYTNSMSSK
jgi:hypothetical protein